MVLGLTGGVGAGKSTVANILKKEYGAKLILADDVAKEIMLPDNDAYNRVVSHYGKDILKADNQIDNDKLARIVFNDSNELKWLNSVTHPLTIQRIQEYINSYLENDEKFIVLESALLARAGCNDMCDYILFISTSSDERIARLKSDRGYDEKKSVSVMSKQDDDDWFIRMSDDIIINNGDIHLLEKQIQVKINELRKRFDI